MVGRLLPALCAIAIATGCGQVSLPFAHTATASDVALHDSDLPSALQRCADSGQVNAYLDNIKRRQPSAYKPSVDEWNSLRAEGADDAWIGVYADNANECTSIFGGTAGQGTTTQNPKLAQNIVVRFKDEKSAQTAYKNGMGQVRPDQISNQPGLTRGNNTGLGANSMVYFSSLGGRMFYLAFWQNKTFTVLLATSNLPETDAKRATSDINGRI